MNVCCLVLIKLQVKIILMANDKDQSLMAFKLILEFHHIFMLQ